MLLLCTSASSPLLFGVVWARRLVYYFIYFLKCSLPNNTTACLLDRAKKDTHSSGIKTAAAKSQILREKVSLELSFPFRLCPYRHITLSRNQLVGGWERLDGKKSVERKSGRELRLRVTKLVRVNKRAKHVTGLAKKGARQSLDCRTKAIQGHITSLTDPSPCAFFTAYIQTERRLWAHICCGYIRTHSGLSFTVQNERWVLVYEQSDRDFRK